MRRSMKISAEMYKLLIERTLDGFSVIELRDEFIVIKDSIIDPDEAYKKVYRQILRFIKKGWLNGEGSGRQKRYFQTDTFKALHAEPKSENVDIEIVLNQDYSVLVSERNQYKGELEIVLGEIDEYQSLNIRFPELEPKLITLLDEAKERSACLLGKVNGLTNVLKVLSGQKIVHQKFKTKALLFERT
ncbi:transcriptional regulator VspR [Vibrio cholerae]|uniref:transcriptional regulator VspR n=1 Tax=Vibrio cholerae TaxID=666 RepID=UPI0009AC43BD|nr:transcriptional regulator VspR [Vibrio cholerae]